VCAGWCDVAYCLDGQGKQGPGHAIGRSGRNSRVKVVSGGSGRRVRWSQNTAVNEATSFIPSHALHLHSIVLLLRAGLRFNGKRTKVKPAQERNRQRHRVDEGNRPMWQMIIGHALNSLDAFLCLLFVLPRSNSARSSRDIASTHSQHLTWSTSSS